jgi:hypothetical protein
MEKKPGNPFTRLVAASGQAPPSAAAAGVECGNPLSPFVQFALDAIPGALATPTSVVAGVQVSRSS